jgi:hypothetical protein
VLKERVSEVKEFIAALHRGDLFTGCVRHTYVSSANFEWFLLRNPELISIPSGFLYGFVGTLISKELHPGGALRRAVRTCVYRRRSREGSGSPRAPDSLGVKLPVTGRIAPP